MKVDEQTDRNGQEPEMGQQLRMIDGMQNFFAFDLHDHTAFDN